LTSTARPRTVELPGFFGRYQPLISAALRAELAGKRLPLFDALRYHMGWVDEHGQPSDSGGGKAFRPTLCLLSCEAAGGAPERALPVAVALEFVHNFSLIHDDIQDKDRTRRGRPTVWAVWDIPTAIVAGNAMLKVADLAASQLAGAGASTATALEAGEALTRGYLRMMEGQYLDIEFETREAITVQEYLDMIERKTGALIETAVCLGPLVAGQAGPDRALAEGLRVIGWELGRVFQIRDDILGVWGGPKTGKPVGADIQRKKKSLPVVHALDAATGAPAAELHAIYRKGELGGGDVERVLEIMDGLGAQNYCQKMAEERWRHGRTVIKSLKLAGETAREFEELGEFLLVRES
jgi:geranylgeranyl diphosphate synthase type I